MEYLYTNLPRYVTVTPRSAFANSVVQSGSVLLFSEDGTTLTAKLPDGSFITVGGGSGGATDFYKCASVSGPYSETYYEVSGAGTTACNGNYTDTGTTRDGKPVYSYTNSGTTYYLFYDSGWEAWFIHTSTSFSGEEAPSDESLYYLSDWEPDAWYVGGAGSNDPPTVTLTTVTHDLPKTWTGYKAVWDSASGVYSFESSVTSSLTYGSGFTPEVGKIYDNGAFVRAELYTGIPENGLVLYIPLSSSANVAETGQTLTTVGSGLVYSTVDGIPCCAFSGGSYIGVGTDSLPLGNFTVSYWVKFTGTDWGIIYTQPGMNTGVDSTSLNFGNYTQWGVVAATNTAIWHHFAVTRDNDTVKVYLDGVNTPESTGTQSLYVDNAYCYLGVHPDGYSYPFVGNLAAVRVYNRALSAGEIAGLAREFTPTQA